jgi:hypothetical protein
MDFVEIEAAVGGAGYGQVTVVYGVEGSAKQRDAARMMFDAGALRLRCGQYPSQGSLRLVSHKFFNDAGDVSCGAGPTLSLEAARSATDSGVGLGILSRASAIERTRSRTPSPVTAEMA